MREVDRRNAARAVKFSQTANGALQRRVELQVQSGLLRRADWLVQIGGVVDVPEANVGLNLASEDLICA